MKKKAGILFKNINQEDSRAFNFPALIFIFKTFYPKQRNKDLKLQGVRLKEYKEKKKYREEKKQ